MAARSPPMGYPLYARMSDADLNDVVAYLRGAGEGVMFFVATWTDMIATSFVGIPPIVVTSAGAKSRWRYPPPATVIVHAPR